MSSKKALRGGKHKELRWKLIFRVKDSRVELVQVPLFPYAHGESKEIVIRVLKGGSGKGILARENKTNKPGAGDRRPSTGKKSRGKQSTSMGMLSDSSGRIALRAFEVAVRKAKRK